jgi:hypothetical protein
METEDGSRMGVTAGLASARARIDERMTCAKDAKRKSCRVMTMRWRGRKPVFSQKAHPHEDARGHTRRASVVYLTLVSSSVQRGLGAELSASSVDRRTTVGARRASFGAPLSGWKEVERRRVRVETRTQKKQTHDTAQRSDGGGRNARTQARRGSLICWSTDI